MDWSKLKEGVWPNKKICANCKCIMFIIEIFAKILGGGGATTINIKFVAQFMENYLHLNFLIFLFVFIESYIPPFSFFFHLLRSDSSHIFPPWRRGGIEFLTLELSWCFTWYIGANNLSSFTIHILIENTHVF